MAREAQHAAVATERQRRRLRQRCKDFATYIKLAWPVLEPETKFVDGWHLHALAEHLEAVSAGQIKRLIINIPPGCMKSLMASVFWPTWEWGPNGRPGLRYLTTSYQEGYAKRDARKHRDLVLSEWYRALWPIELLREGEMSFENTARGGREAKPFASLTAGRGNRVIIDDPHSTETAESDTDRARATRIFRESVTSRLNDVRHDAIVLIMHRLHTHDLCGVVEQLKMPYEKLILPMEFELKRRCTTVIGFKDPRTKEGELLFPARFPAPEIARDKTALGSYAYAGQYQQRPAPREGGMFKREWFAKARGRFPEGATRVRRWDLAATVPKAGSDPDWTAGVLLARWENRWRIEDVVRFRLTANEVRTRMKATAQADGGAVDIWIPQDPGQAGKDQAQSLVAMLAGFNAYFERETGDKATRAEPFAAQCEAGNVSLTEGEWNEDFIEELCTFPMGHDDQVDAASGAFAKLPPDDNSGVQIDTESLRRVNPMKVGTRIPPSESEDADGTWSTG